MAKSGPTKGGNIGGKGAPVPPGHHQPKPAPGKEPFKNWPGKHPDPTMKPYRPK